MKNNQQVSLSNDTTVNKMFHSVGNLKYFQKQEQRSIQAQRKKSIKLLQQTNNYVVKINPLTQSKNNKDVQQNDQISYKSDEKLLKIDNPMLNSNYSQQSKASDSTTKILTHDFIESFTLILYTLVNFYSRKLQMKQQLRPYSHKIIKYIMSQSHTKAFNLQEINKQQISICMHRFLHKKFQLKMIHKLYDHLFGKVQGIGQKQFNDLFKPSIDEVELGYKCNQKSMQQTKIMAQTRKFLIVAIQQMEIQSKLKAICIANDKSFMRMVISVSKRDQIDLKQLISCLQQTNCSWNSSSTKQLKIYMKYVVGTSNFNRFIFVKWIRSL